MTNATRREVLRVLEELSAISPEVRFGQLIANLSYLARGPANESIWDMEDQELLAAARKQLETLRTGRGRPLPRPMIRNDEELKVVRGQLELIEGALESLKRDVLPKSRANFRVMAEQYDERIADDVKGCLGTRVIVRGLLKTAAKGRRLTMEVQSIHPLGRPALQSAS